MRRDLSILDRDICQPLGRILQEAFSEGIACRVNIRFDSEQYKGDIIGLQLRPAGNVAVFPADYVTDDQGNKAGDAAIATIYGAQIMPRFNNGVPGNSLVGAFVNPILKGTTGNLSGDLRGLEVKIETEGYTGTRVISGIASVLDCKQRLAEPGTYTGGIFVLRAQEKDGLNVEPWTAFALLPNDSELAAKETGTIAKLTDTNAYIRVKIGDTIYRVPGYEDADPD